MKLNCIVIDVHEKSIVTIEEVIKRLRSLHLLGTCRSRKEANQALSENDVEIAFIDPGMPGLDNNASIIQPMLEHVKHIIVISEKRATAKEAFDLGATDFLLKPISSGRLVRAFNKVVKANLITLTGRIKQEHDYFFVKVKSDLVRVERDDIILVEALADYALIHTRNGRYTVHSTMTKMEAWLGNRYFVRVHKSYLVRFDLIENVSNNMLVIGDHTVPVSRNHRKQLLDKLEII